GRALRDQYGWLFKPYPGTGIEPPRWKLLRIPDGEMEKWLRQNIYEKRLPALFVPALIACLTVTVIGVAGAIVVDQRLNRKYEQGRRLRGSRLVAPGEYEREVKGADGLALVVKDLEPESGLVSFARRLARREEPSWRLRMKR